MRVLMLPQTHPNASDPRHIPTQSKHSRLRSPRPHLPKMQCQLHRDPQRPRTLHHPSQSPHRPEAMQQHQPRHQIPKPPQSIHQRRRLAHPRRLSKRRLKPRPANPMHKVRHPVRQECPTQKLQQIKIPRHQLYSQHYPLLTIFTADAAPSSASLPPESSTARHPPPAATAQPADTCHTPARSAAPADAAPRPHPQSGRT